MSVAAPMQKALLSSTPDLGNLPKRHLIQSQLGTSVAYCQRPSLGRQIICVFICYLILAYFQIGL